MRKSCFIVLILLSACIGLSSCKGINRGEGYVFQWSKDANYVVMTISDTEYIHFLMDSGIGEWVTDTGSSPITIRSVYYPVNDANAYRLVRYSSKNDSDFAKLFLGFDVSENTSSESFYLSNPDRKKVLFTLGMNQLEVSSMRQKLKHLIEKALLFLSLLLNGKNLSIIMIPQYIGHWSTRFGILPAPILASGMSTTKKYR